MIKLQESIQIGKPQSLVFGVVSDISKIPQWQSEVVKSTAVTPGPMKMGTKFDEVVKIGPFKVTTHCEVTKYEPQKLITFTAKSSPSEYGAQFTVEPEGQSCRATVDGTANLRGIWKIMEPLMASDVKKGIKKEMADLKKLCEGS